MEENRRGVLGAPYLEDSHDVRRAHILLIHDSWYNVVYE